MFFGAAFCSVPLSWEIVCALGAARRVSFGITWRGTAAGGVYECMVEGGGLLEVLKMPSES